MSESCLETYRFVLKYFGRLESLPGYREMAEKLGHSSHSTVQSHINTLIRHRYLVRHEGRLAVPFTAKTADYLREIVLELLMKVNEYN